MLAEKPGKASALHRPARLAALLLLLLAALPLPLHAQDAAADARAAPEVETTAAPAATARDYMIAAAHPLAVRAGADILAQGGSAIDAAIAAQMVLGLVEPQSSGLGGGGFLLHWDNAAKTLATYDGRETAPAGADENLFLDGNGRPKPWPEAAGTPSAVGVPGLLAMLHAAHKTNGRLPWKDLFDHAIALARNGFGVSPRLSALLARRGPDGFSPAARQLYFDAEGRARPLGHVVRNPALSDTLERIAKEGPSAFYSGPVAADILAALAAAPGAPSAMTAADLADYRALVRPPVCLPYRAVDVCGMGPPSSGGIAIAQTLGILEHFDLGGAPSAGGAHLVIEAQNLAFADRNRYLADPAFAALPDGLLDPAYLRERARLIDPDHAGGTRQAGTPPSRAKIAPGEDATIEAPGTTHLSVIDGAGNAVSLTSSIETAFGSGIMARGFLLNNQLTDFAFRPADNAGRPLANRPQGGKRPRSSMAPTMVFDADGRLSAVLGSPGGSRIIAYVVQTLIALIDWQMEPQQAVARGHFAARNRGVAEVEAGAANDALAEGLAALGHRVVRPAMTSGLHVITRRDGMLRAGADPRREGAAVGR